MQSSDRRLHYVRKKLLGVFTWSVEVALNTDLENEKEGIFLVVEALLNLGDDLNSLGSPFGKIIKPLITLVGFQGVEPWEFLRSRGSHFSPHEQDVEPKHVSPSIGCCLEHRQPVEVEDVPEELVQQKSHPKFEECFWDRHISLLGLVHFAQLPRCHHLHLVVLYQPAGLLIGECRCVMCAAPFYMTWRAHFSLIMFPYRSGAPFCSIVLTGDWFLP